MRAIAVLKWPVILAWLAIWWLVFGLPALGLLLMAHAAPAIPLPRDLPRRDGGRMVLDHAYGEAVGQLYHVHAEGPPAVLGWSQGVLVGDRITRIESDLMEVFCQRVPSWWGRHAILGLVGLGTAWLPDRVAPDEQAEILGITAAHRRFHDPWRGLWPSYARGLHYHAAHDVSQHLIDNPLVQAPQVGCTAVASGPTRSADGHLLVGRLFDFEGGTRFDDEKVVYTLRPEGGLRSVSVAWGGMAGAVTGLNEAGLWISINAGPNGRPRLFRSGRPLILVVREVLDRCRTIDEAVRLLEGSEVFTAACLLIASGPEGRAVVVEKSLDATAVRPMRDGLLAVANHFEGDATKGSSANALRLAAGTTAARQARAERLLAQGGPHTPASLLTLLRDHRGADGGEVGFGNRSTINAWIGAHLVVADLTAGVLWVCEPSHGLGLARAFTVNGPAEQPPLPASDELGLYRSTGGPWRAACAEARRLLRAGDRDGARIEAERALALAPDSYESCWLAGASASDPVRRRELLERALTLQPAYAAEAVEIRRLLQP